MGYPRIYFGRGMAIGLFGALSSALGIFLVLQAAEAGLIQSVIKELAAYNGVDTAAFEPNDGKMETLGKTGGIQLFALETALIGYFCLRLLVDYLLTAGGLISTPGRTFSNTIGEALLEATRELLVFGIPFTVLIFCATAFVATGLFADGELSESLLQTVVYQSLTLTPMLVFFEIGATPLMR